MIGQMSRNRVQTLVRAAPIRGAMLGMVLAAALAAPASALDTLAPSPFGSPAEPYAFAQPVPIYPTPGENVLSRREGGAMSYEQSRENAARTAAMSRDPNPSPPSARIDTRIAPLN
jgi:hypothetical protein